MAIFIQEISMHSRNVRVSARAFRARLAGLGAVTLAVSMVACGGNSGTSSTSSQPSSPSGTPGGQKVDTSTAGDVKGTVTIDGMAPQNASIKMNADPKCVSFNKSSPQFQETYEVGGDGKTLANVFVYVKD